MNKVNVLLISVLRFRENAFQNSEKSGRFYTRKMCLCIYKLFKLYLQRRSCLFLQKGEKTAELVFLFWGILGTIFQISPVYSFLIFTYSR